MPSGDQPVCLHPICLSHPDSSTKTSWYELSSDSFCWWKSRRWGSCSFCFLLSFLFRSFFPGKYSVLVWCWMVMAIHQIRPIEKSSFLQRTGMAFQSGDEEVRQASEKLCSVAGQQKSRRSDAAEQSHVLVDIRDRTLSTFRNLCHLWCN